jgi:hypothetical protein
MRRRRREVGAASIGLYGALSMVTSGFDVRRKALLSVPPSQPQRHTPGCSRLQITSWLSQGFHCVCRQEIWFTKNGRFLGAAFTGIFTPSPPPSGPSAPSRGPASRSASVGSSILYSRCGIVFSALRVLLLRHHAPHHPCRTPTSKSRWHHPRPLSRDGFINPFPIPSAVDG